MFQLALIDDDRIFLTEVKKEIEKILAGEGAAARVAAYASPREFWDDSKEGNLQKYDLYLLDVEMPEGGGLALAEKIREADEDAALVFLTNYERFALDGFRVEARNYFLKTDWKEGMGRWLPKFYRKWKEGREGVDRGYWYDYDGIQCRIPIRDIEVLEYDTWNHQLIIHARGEVFRERKSLKNILVELDSEDFVQVRKGGAVHLAHIEKTAGDEIVLKSGHRVPISRNYKKAFLERYQQYMGRKMR